MSSALVASLAVVVSLLALAAVLAAVWFRRPDLDPAGLALIQSRLDEVSQQQGALRRDLQAGREAAVRDLGEATRRLQSDLGEARRSLSEVRAAEEARGRSLERAVDSLKRLEAVVAGSASRGVAGENLLAEALSQLPPDLLEHDVPFGSRVVEFALRLPGGRYLPIDSKWPAASALEQLQHTEDPVQRRTLRESVSRELRSRVREVARYVDPERTLSLAVLAVPDAVCAAAPDALSDGWREGVLVVPYSLALAQVLSIYRLSARFGAAAAADDLPARLARLGESLHRIDDEVEGRLSRALVQVQNSRDALRSHLSDARREAVALASASEPAGAESSPAFAPAERNR